MKTHATKRIHLKTPKLFLGKEAYFAGIIIFLISLAMSIILRSSFGAMAFAAVLMPYLYAPLKGIKNIFKLSLVAGLMMGIFQGAIALSIGEYFLPQFLWVTTIGIPTVLVSYKLGAFIDAKIWRLFKPRTK